MTQMDISTGNKKHTIASWSHLATIYHDMAKALLHSSFSKTLCMTREEITRVLAYLQKAERAYFHLTTLTKDDQAKRAELFLSLGKLYLFEMELRRRARILIPLPPSPAPALFQTGDDNGTGMAVEEEEDEDERRSLSLEIFDEPDLYDSDPETDANTNTITNKPTNNGANGKHQNLEGKPSKNKTKEDEAEVEQGPRFAEDPDPEITQPCAKLGTRSYDALKKASLMAPDLWVYPYMLARISLKLKKSSRFILKKLQEAFERLEKATGTHSTFDSLLTLRREDEES